MKFWKQFIIAIGLGWGAMNAIALPNNRIDSYTLFDYSNPNVNPANLDVFYNERDFGYELKSDFGIAYFTSNFTGTDAASGSGFDEWQQLFDSVTALDDDFSIDTANALLQQSNNLIQESVNKFQLTIASSIESPLTLYWKTANLGYITVGQNWRTITDLKVIFNEFSVNPVTNNPEASIIPYISHLSALDFYWNHGIAMIDTNKFEVNLGYRAKISDYRLFHQAFYLNADNIDNFGSLASNYLQDQYQSIGKIHANLDVGVNVKYRYMSAGLQIRNAIPSQLSYNTIGKNCSNIVATEQRDLCWTTRMVADQIPLERKHTISPVIVLNGSLHDPMRIYSISAAISKGREGTFNEEETWFYGNITINLKDVDLKLHLAHLFEKETNANYLFNDLNSSKNYIGFSIELFSMFELVSFISTTNVDNSVATDESLYDIRNATACGYSNATNCFLGIRAGMKF